MKSAMRELENVKKDGDSKDSSPAMPEKKFVNTGKSAVLFYRVHSSVHNM